MGYLDRPRRRLRKLRRAAKKLTRYIRGRKRQGKRSPHAAKRRYWVWRRAKRKANWIRRQENRASRHFSLDEFACNDGTPVPENSIPAIRHLARNYLEPLRNRFGTVVVHSGYRTASWNAKVKGATYSQHRYDLSPKGVAADITCAKGSPRDWYSFLNARNPGGLGLYNTFVHVDNRQLEGEPKGRWTG